MLLSVFDNDQNLCILSSQVPAYETKDGKHLTGGSAIAYFVATEQLRGKTAWDQVQILQWVDLSNRKILPLLEDVVYMCRRRQNFEDPLIGRVRVETKSLLHVVNQHLSDKSYLVGESISLADIVVFSDLLVLYGNVVKPYIRPKFWKINEFLNVSRWFTTLLNHPQVLSVVSNFESTKKTVDLHLKKYARFAAKTVATEPRCKEEYAEPTFEVDGVSIWYFSYKNCHDNELP